jgi:hypothetical protein
VPENISRRGVGKLVLNREGLRNHAASLFDQLDKDDAAKQAFLNDPVGQLAGGIAEGNLPPQQISDANRLLFATLANDKFREWLDNYEARPNGQRVSDEQFARDYADALIKYGDSDLLQAALQHAANTGEAFGFDEVAQQLVTGPEKSVITSPATPSTSDQTLHSIQNFNNKQSGVQIGDNDLVDPARLRAVTDLLVDKAKELKNAGQLAARGGAVQ